MPKKPKEENIDLYRFNNGQDQNIENLMERKKEREKRIKERNNIQKEENEFDFDTETVIGMTNKNNKKKQDEMKKEFAKKQRKRDKRLKRIKFFLKLILFIGVVSGIIAFATCSPIFNIQNIEVINNKQLSPETIISLSELSINQNIFKFWENDVENKIRANAYIESVELKRVFPNKLQINIQEREPKFSVPVLGEYAYINTQGYILEITQNQLNLPIINGISTKEEEIKPGNRLNNKDLTELEIILKIISAMKENQLDKEVTSIDISNKNDYIIYMQNEKKKIHLGDGSNLSNKMLYVIAIINEEKGKEGEIFANGDLNQKFKVYFREKV